MAAMKILLILLQLFSVCSGQYYGPPLGPFVDINVGSGISGKVYVVDDAHFAIEDFSYNGLAQDVYFWVERKNSIPGLSDGLTIPDELGSSEPLPPSDQKTILLELPPDVQVSDLSRLHLWCREEDIYLAHVDIPEDLDVPGPQFIGEFLLGDHDVRSNNIVIEDGHTIRLDNFYYDGLAQDLYFIMGNGTRVGQGFYMKLPDENGSPAPLGRYDGQTIRIQLPEGTSLVDQKYVALYSEEYKLAFAYVTLPCDLNVPPSPAVFGIRSEQPRIGVTREVQTSTPCSFEKKATDVQGCLNAIRLRALDETAFVFPRNPGTIDSDFSVSTFVPRSLVQQIFGVADQVLSSIDRPLRQRYTSPAGSYTGCDHTFSMPYERFILVDPLSNIPYPSWHLRMYPNTTWDHNEGELFSSFLFDPTRLKPIEIYVNIVGDDYASGISLLDYIPPSNPTIYPRPYVMIIYKQTTRVPVQRLPSFRFNVTEFAERKGLEGPIGITWVDAVADASSVEGRWGQNCASLVAAGLRPDIPNWTFVDPNQFELSVFLRVHFTSPAFNYTCGPYTIAHPPVDTYLDSIAYNPIDAAIVRTESQMTFSMEMSHMDPRPTDFSGKIYTIMIANPITHFVNGLFINVDGADPNNSGSARLPYFAPQLFGDQTSENLVFLLYEQTAQIDSNNNLERFSRPCPLPNRCFTDIGEFVSVHGLRLVGVARMDVIFEEYSRCTAQTF